MDIKVGIIGDGQLGMFLCQAAKQLNIETVLLSSDENSPAAKSASSAVIGAMDCPTTLDKLIAQADVITYEREDVPPAAVARLRQAEANGSVRCHPSLDVIELIQDKAKQKTWLAENDLATLPFHIVNGSEAELEAGVADLGLPVIQKALRGGFDGRGVQLLRSPEDLAKAWPGATLLEKYAGKFREIAVLVARGTDGSTTHFGPVDMTFETDYSVLDTVIAPASVDEATTERAIDLAYRAIEALEGVGVFGVEMFLLEDGQVLINEISPRVHNAGHFSIEACANSQFVLHLQAVTGQPLGSTELRGPASMRNLLCTPALKHEDIHRDADALPSDNNETVHWYGKSPARLMRKLGHVTALRSTPEDARAAVDKVWESIQEEAASA